jgi:hypothetical protein
MIEYLNDEEIWTESYRKILEAKAKTENEKALAELNLARAELEHEMIILAAQLKRGNSH